MSTPVAITIPERLIDALHENLDSDVSQWALEAMVLEAVREGLISRGRGGEILGLNFHEREELFARRHMAYDLSDEELAQDRADMDRILGT